LGFAQAQNPNRFWWYSIQVRFRIEAAKAPVTAVDEEYLMSTEDVYTEWRRETLGEGVATGERRLLLQLLGRRFGDLPAAVLARVEAADVTALEAFAARLLVAKTADEVVAEE
jgi:hypothetical protein